MAGNTLTVEHKRWMVYQLIERKPHRWIAEKIVETFPDLVKPGEKPDDVVAAMFTRIHWYATDTKYGWRLAVKIGREAREAELENRAMPAIPLASRDAQLRALQELWDNFEVRTAEKGVEIDGEEHIIYKDHTRTGLEILKTIRALCDEVYDPTGGVNLVLDKPEPASESTMPEDPAVDMISDMELVDDDTFG